MQTLKLSGAALDWAVAKCEGKEIINSSYTKWRGFCIRGGMVYSPSTDWAQGGPIIEREGILLRPLRKDGHAMDGFWLAMYDGENTGTMVQWVKREDWPRHYLKGSTPLIAAMRRYVASKLGDTVEMPKELTE